MNEFRVTQGAARPDINTTTQGPTATLWSLPVPHGVELDVTINTRVLNPLGSACICLTHPAELHVPSFTEPPYASLGTGVTNASDIVALEVRTDTKGRVRLVANVSNVTVKGSVVKWRIPPIPKPSGLAWDSRLVAPGGRIDSMRDLGCGVFICGGRGANAGKLFISTDYGDTWSLAQQLSSATGISTLASDDTYAYALLEDSRLFQSADRGRTWALVKTVSANPPVGTLTRSYGLCVLPSGTVLVADCSANGHVFRSADHCATFTDCGPVGDCPLYRLQCIGDGVLVNGWSGKVWKSCDDGLTFTPHQVVDSNGAGACYSIECAPDGTVYMGTDRGQVLKSCDNAVTWECVGLVAAETDDFARLGDDLILTTYTGSHELYRIDAGGPVNLGPPPTTGWFDHLIGAVDSQGCPMLIGGTSDGYVLRARKS
jgi:hypothetical protein